MDCETTVVVPASADRVWDRWTDVERWPEWNPMCRSATVDPGRAEGARMRLELVHPRGRSFITAPVWEELDAPRRARWAARAAGLRAEVVSVLSPEEDGTRLTVTAAAHGAMAFTYRLVMRPRVQAELHTRMLNALVASFADA